MTLLSKAATLAALLASLASLTAGEPCTANADCVRGDGLCFNGQACFYQSGGCYAGFYYVGANMCGVCPDGTTSEGHDQCSGSCINFCYAPCGDGSQCYTPYGGSAQCQVPSNGGTSTCLQTCNTPGQVVAGGDTAYVYCYTPNTPSGRARRRAIVERFSADEIDPL